MDNKIKTVLSFPGFPIWQNESLRQPLITSIIILIIQIMQTSISIKTQSLRKQFRNSEVDLYRKSIREKVVKSRMREEESLELNRKVEGLLGEENLEELYEYLYRNKRKEKNQNEAPCAHLSLINIENLLFFLLKRLNVVKSLLILNNLFELHYRFIFLEPSHAERNKNIVRKLYDQANSVILAYGSGNYRESQNPNSLINSLLNCLKSLIFDKDESYQNFTFTEVVREEYLLAYIFKWFHFQVDNPLYLMILVIIESDLSISALEPVKKELNSDSKLMLKLLHQSNPDNNVFKSNSLPSMILANLFVFNIQNKQILEELVEPFLETSKMVYELMQVSKREFYRSNTFIDTATSCIIIFESLQNIALKCPLSQHMRNTNYSTFSTIILRSEPYMIREKILALVKSSLRNLLVCKAPLQDFMTESLIRMLGEGIEGQCVDIVIHCLHCYSSIYSYIQEHLQSSQTILSWVDNFDIDTALESMVYHPNQELKELAICLAEKKTRVDTNHKGDMETEPM